MNHPLPAITVPREAQPSLGSFPDIPPLRQRASELYRELPVSCRQQISRGAFSIGVAKERPGRPG